ncbi:MAG: phosphatidylglycerophosphatase A [Mariprofundaceae bacterium]
MPHARLHVIAAGLGSGWLPKAPGTWGSLAALIPGWLILGQFGINGLLFASLALLTSGCYICKLILPELDSDDPGWIVIDEWVGQWLCTAIMALFIPLDFMLLLISFLMFRLFDILKPWPISWLEEIGPKWWSIMADDVGAGVLGSLLGVLIMKLFAGSLF